MTEKQKHINDDKITRFPPWLRKRLPAGGKGETVRAALKELRLATVCSSAHCPNMCECFAQGTATFMILGDLCTRGCKFCAVRSKTPLPPDPEEPRRAAEAAARLNLSYVVVTSVTRDDLPDGGAEHFRRVIKEITRLSGAPVEVLTPDFGGRRECVEIVLSARPAVFNHNIETVPRMYSAARPEADYQRSLNVLRMASEIAPDIPVKSGMMVGLGEKEPEVLDVMRDLYRSGCRLLTIGQYLRPSPEHLPVDRFVTPEEFERYSSEGGKIGFDAVFAGPFVRSSYRAGELMSDMDSEKEIPR